MKHASRVGAQKWMSLKLTEKGRVPPRLQNCLQLISSAQHFRMCPPSQQKLLQDPENECTHPIGARNQTEQSEDIKMPRETKRHKVSSRWRSSSGRRARVFSLSNKGPLKPCRA